MPNAPRKNDGTGLSVIELMRLFPTEAAARQWFESHAWPAGRCCGKCGSMNTRRVPNEKPMPYWCRNCRSYFSVRTGTAIERSKIPLQKWAIAMYLDVTSLTGISSIKLHRDIGVSQKAAWFMLHRIREAWSRRADGPNNRGSIEVDETDMGDRAQKNYESQKLKASRCTIGKTAVVGAKDHATIQASAKFVKPNDRENLQGFVAFIAAPNSAVNSDNSCGHKGLKYQESVKHSVGGYARGSAYKNGLESSRTILSPTHRDRYVRQFAQKTNILEVDTLKRMSQLFAKLVVKRLMCYEFDFEIELPLGERA